MRWLCVLLFVVGCGGGPRAAKTPKPDLPDGSGVYTVRFNPPACCEPHLHFELQTADGWERVAVEGVDDDEVVDQLLTEMGAAPNRLRHVDGELVDRVVEWSGRHVARVLVIRQLDPPAPDER